MTMTKDILDWYRGPRRPRINVIDYDQRSKIREFKDQKIKIRQDIVSLSGLKCFSHLNGARHTMEQNMMLYRRMIKHYTGNDPAMVAEYKDRWRKAIKSLRQFRFSSPQVYPNLRPYYVDPSRNFVPFDVHFPIAKTMIEFPYSIIERMTLSCFNALRNSLLEGNLYAQGLWTCTWDVDSQTDIPLEMRVIKPTDARKDDVAVEFHFQCIEDQALMLLSAKITKKV